MWPIPVSFNLLRNQLLHQECVCLSAVIFRGKGAEIEGKCCLFIQLLLQLRQNTDLGTELEEEGQFAAICWLNLTGNFQIWIRKL